MSDLKSRSASGLILDMHEDTKTATYFHQDPVTEKTIIETVSDVTDIIEDNKAQFNAFDERAKWRTKDMGMNHVGCIPMYIVMSPEFQKIVQNKDKQALFRFLNDYNNRAFRTRPGRL